MKKIAFKFLSLFIFGVFMMSLMGCNNESGQTEGRESVRPDFDADQLMFINQGNQNLISSQIWPTFVTADAVYLAIETEIGYNIIRFTDQFSNSETIAELEGWIARFHVFADAIYYMVFAEDGEHLYRYDRLIKESVRVVSDITLEVIKDDLVVHTDVSKSGIYVSSMENGGRMVLIDQTIMNFVIDPPGGRIFFNSPNDEGNLSLYYSYLDGTNQARLHPDGWDFAFDGNTIAITSRGGFLSTMDTVTGELQANNNAFRFHSILFVADYILGLTLGDNLYLFSLANLNDYSLIAENVMHIASTGYSIILKYWDDDNIYHMTLSGEVTPIVIAQ